MEPVEIKRVDNDKIYIQWLDGFASTISLKDLRENCPCAECQGEQIGFKKIKPIKLDVYNPNKYEIKSIETVGNYAIQITWGDGHDTGIYSFDYLRSIMEQFAI